MAVAGKVAITLSTENGGAWSADVTYDRLVAVKHNNNLYISRKTVANVEPPNDEFWFLALEGFGGDDIEDIINGTTQVGNAKTLDGHGADYFFPKTGGEIDGNVTQKTDDSTKAVVYELNTPNRTIKIAVLANGTFGILDATNGEWIIAEESDGTRIFDGIASGNLPLTGGEISGTLTLNGGTSSADLIMRRTMTSGKSSRMNSWMDDKTPMCRIRVRNVDDDTYGTFDISEDSVLFTPKGTTEAKTLLHTGNKPTGTYTGNGSTEQRAIYVGGIGNILHVYNSTSGTSAIVTPYGAIRINSSGTVTGYAPSVVRFLSGYLYTSTDAAEFNESGNTYGYDLL